MLAKSKRGPKPFKRECSVKQLVTYGSQKIPVLIGSLVRQGSRQVGVSTLARHDSI